MTRASKSPSATWSTVVSTATGPSSRPATVTATSSSPSRYSGYNSSMSSKSSAARRSTLRPASTMPPTLRPRFFAARAGRSGPGGLAHRVAVEGDGVLAPGAQADVASHIPQELVGIEVVVAQAIEIDAVLAQRGNARGDGGGDVGKVGRVAGAGHVGVADGLAGRPGLG